MLPSKGGSSNQTTTNTNRSLIKSAIERTVVRLKETTNSGDEEDVTRVEYDIINYYADAATPGIATVSPRHQQQQQSSTSLSSSSSARRGSNHNNADCHPALDASGVVVAPARKTTAPGSMEMDVEAAEATVRPLNQKKREREQQQSEQQPLPSTRSRGGGGAVQSRLRRHPAVIVPARSQHPESSNYSNCSSNSNSPSSSASSAANRSPCSTLGVNMRVTGQCSQGGRKYMEDQFSVAYQESPLTHELEYAFFGIYDGHGGPEAALFAKEHLMLEIVKQKHFWSDNDEDVLRAIREGYIATHFAMWREQEKWPRTANGHLSTAGTTATVAFMRREKIYIGHVGDSGIVLGYQRKGERNWRSRQLTTDHKPESVAEKMRIQRSGGNVAIKSGVPRVVWNRPRDPMHRGPIRLRTVVDDIPFLAVARSLGDLWSYNSRCKEFVVSPDPDVKVVKIDPSTFRCLIFGTDGLWNVVTAQEAVDNVRKEHLIGEILNEQDVMNPSKALVDQALKTWASKKMRADNTSVVTVILTPAASHHSHNSQQASATAQAQSALARDPDLDVELLLEAEECEDNEEEEDDDAQLDVENYPLEFHIEEEEYILDTPYSALAKRHLPPEAYRNFDYFGLDEDTPDEEAEAEEDEDEEAIQRQQHHHQATQAGILQQSLFSPRKSWRKSTWNGQTELEPDPEPEPDEPHPALDMCAIYANSIVPSASSTTATAATNSNPSAPSELEQHLESSYSFAESYNSLLNEQEEQEARSRSAAAAAAAGVSGATSSTPTPVHSASVVVDRSMQEIIQEQQHYQQQEGYSLTQLETRREQMQQEREQEREEAWQQPAELLELDALLQQERAEEEQVALEQQQQQREQQQQMEEHRREEQQRQEQQREEQKRKEQQQREKLQQEEQQREQQQREREEQQMEVASSSSGQQEFGYSSNNCSTTLPQGHQADEAEMVMDIDQELQDNEVSSTLPATPTPQMEQPAAAAAAGVMPQQEDEKEKQVQKKELEMERKMETEEGLSAALGAVAEIRKEDVHYIFEQIQKLQETEISPTAPNSGVEEALELALAGEPRIRHMRRYRNVPNENHQHMQTRRRQMFKHAKPKSFINSSAAAIVAYSDSSSTSSSAGGGVPSGSAVNSNDGHHHHRVGGGVGGAGGGLASGSNTSVVTTTNNRRRSVTVLTGAASSSSSSVGMTRRSHSHSVSVSVSKRQLRSSLCNLGHDITKRTLRTRNVPIATGGGGSPSPVVPANGNISSPLAATSSRVASTPDSNSSGSRSASNSSSRRLKLSHNDREQRRSLRRSTLSASVSGTVSGGGVAAQSKPTRLQACNGAISARPPPSPKKLNTSVPTLAIGTRAYTAALAAAADHLNKRWSLRSSSSSSNGGGGSMMTAISCYSARSRAAAAAAAAAAAGGGGQAAQPALVAGGATGAASSGGSASASANNGPGAATRKR